MALLTDKDGNQFWRPSPRQAAFISIPDDIDEALYGGAAGGGKTETLLMLPIVRKFHENPNFHAVLFRRTFPEVEESFEVESRKLYPYFGGKYNATKHFWVFPSGAIIRFKYLERDEDVFAHQSAQYSYIGFDELTHFTEFQYIYMQSRLRNSRDSGLPCIMRAGSNPGNIGHTWVRKRFVEPFKYGHKIIHRREIDKTSGKARIHKLIFIPAKVDDNPHVDPNYKDRLDKLPEADRKALKDGDWWSYSGAVFSEFRSNHYPSEPDNALHVIAPFEIPSWWPKIIAVDWGFTAWSYVLWSALAPDLRLFIYREYAVKKTAIAIWAAEAAKLSQFDGNIKAVVIDPSARKHDASEKSILDQWVEHSKFKQTEVAENDRLSGKSLVHEYLRWYPRPPRYIPPQGFQHNIYERILRVQGPNAAASYKASFLPDEPETNIPRLQIFNTCPKLIDVLPACVYDDKKTEDVMEFDGDDPYDTLRYNLKAADRFCREAKNQASHHQALGKIIEDYNRTGDYQSFDMRMRIFEENKKHSKKFVQGPTLYGKRKRKSVFRMPGL